MSTATTSTQLSSTLFTSTHPLSTSVTSAPHISPTSTSTDSQSTISTQTKCTPQIDMLHVVIHGLPLPIHESSQEKGIDLPYKVCLLINGGEKKQRFEVEKQRLKFRDRETDIEIRGTIKNNQEDVDSEKLDGLTRDTFILVGGYLGKSNMRKCPIDTMCLLVILKTQIVSPSTKK
ncbi:hypothetical protein YC2023_073503 [Brassica napus]